MLPARTLPLLACLLVCLPAAAEPVALAAVVIAAKDASVANSRLSDGSNIDSGEFLSTGSNGYLRLRSGTLQLQLAAATSLQIIREGDHVLIKLGAGTLFYSGQDPAQTLAVRVDDVQFLAPLTTRAVGHVSANSPCTASVKVDQGRLEVTMPKTTLQVRTGEEYRIRLGTAGNSPASSGCASSANPKPPLRIPPYEKIAAAAAIGIPTVIVVIEAWESPDRP